MRDPPGRQARQVFRECPVALPADESFNQMEQPALKTCLYHREAEQARQVLLECPIALPAGESFNQMEPPLQDSVLASRHFWEWVC